MENEKSMTTEQSISLITAMINKARFNFSKGSFFFILWGILLTASACFEFVAHQIYQVDWSWIGWPIVGVIGGILSSIYGARQRKSEPITHLDRIYSSIWVVFLVTLFILIIALVSNRIYPGSYILIITGFPTFLTGYILKFNPLKYGGIGFWLLGIISLYFLDEFSSLIFGVAMIQGYIIPGFIMKSMR